MKVENVFDFYMDRWKNKISKLSLHKQLKMTAGFKIAIVDYCGLSHRYKDLMDKKTRLFLMDSHREEFLKHSEFDVIFVFVLKGSIVNIKYNCIKIEFNRKNLFYT